LTKAGRTKKNGSGGPAQDPGAAAPAGAAPALQVEYLPTADLIPYARNSRTHDDAQVAQIAASIREFGFTNPILVSPDNDIIAGHGRALAAGKLGLDQVPCIRLGHLTPAQRRAYVIADNRLALNAGWDTKMLELEVKDLQIEQFDLSLLGFEKTELDALLAGEGDAAGGTNTGTPGSLAARFGVPPFTVLDGRQGYWRDRKRNWASLGIKSELGRGDVMGSLSSARQAQTGSEAPETWVTTSIFDPVLCELAYRWFSPAGGCVLDPFAGGSVRGIVAARLGREYVGVDLRREQVEANREQARDICAEGVMPVWHCGDSREIERLVGDDLAADMIFSCPPYADLEVYSDNPQDLSTLGYDDFVAAYREIIAAAVRKLKPNRFACFVVGDVRCPKGFYRDFVGDTVQAFRDAGAGFYNESVFVTPVGTLPVRAGRTFVASRKLGKAHQNVLVFCKGDPKVAAAECGNPEFGEGEGWGEEEGADA
jgi:DNA modification methylase